MEGPVAAAHAEAQGLAYGRAAAEQAGAGEFEIARRPFGVGRQQLRRVRLRVVDKPVVQSGRVAGAQRDRQQIAHREHAEREALEERVAFDLVGGGRAVDINRLEQQNAHLSVLDEFDASRGYRLA